MYQVFNVSTRGFSHIKKGTLCEDFGISQSFENAKIFAVADGHGASECFRSNIGSEFICKITMNSLQNFSRDIAENNLQNDLLFYPKKQKAIVRQLISNIFSSWIVSVNNQFTENPITENEKKLSGKLLDAYLNNEKIEHIYGTTLIAGLLTDDYLLLLQQGDGRCVVFDENGIPYQPIPWDDRCFSNVTTSVCDEDAIESCRYCIIDLKSNPILACIAGSDGVEDSYRSMELMYSFYRKLLLFAEEHGIQELQRNLKEELPQISEMGSQDDITICGILGLHKIREKRDNIQNANEVTKLQEIIERSNDKINSMSRKLSYLEEKYNLLYNEYSKLSARYDELKIKKTEKEKSLLEIVTLCDAVVDEKNACDEQYKQYMSEKVALEQEKANHANESVECDGNASVDNSLSDSDTCNLEDAMNAISAKLRVSSGILLTLIEKEKKLNLERDICEKDILKITSLCNESETALFLVEKQLELVKKEYFAYKEQYEQRQAEKQDAENKLRILIAK